MRYAGDGGARPDCSGPADAEVREVLARAAREPAPAG